MFFFYFLIPGSILKLRVYDFDFSGCELFVSIDSQKKCFYGKIQSKARSIDFNRSKHLIASIDQSLSQHPVNLTFLAKKPHTEYFASKDIYNLLTKATSIESNIMESMSVLMKSKSNKNVAEIFFTLIVNLSYFSPIRTFSIRPPDSRAKPSIFTPDTKFNPSKALSQELSKLASPKRVKLNYQLSPKQEGRLFDSLTNQVFNEASSSDFDNNSFFSSSQVEAITEPSEQLSHSSHRKYQSSPLHSNGFEYSSNAENIKQNDFLKGEKPANFDKNQQEPIKQQESIKNQQESAMQQESMKVQAERIKTPETKNSQGILSDVGKHSVRKPVAWRKGKKPEFLKSEKESDVDLKLPSLDDKHPNEEIGNNDSTGNKVEPLKPMKGEGKENESSKDEGDKSGKNVSPIFDLLNAAPHISPKLPLLDKLQISIPPQPNENKGKTNIEKVEKKDDEKNESEKKEKDEVKSEKDEFDFEDEKIEAKSEKEESEKKEKDEVKSDKDEFDFEDEKIEAKSEKDEPEKKEKEEVKSEKEEVKSEKEEVKSEKEEVKSEKEEVKSEKDESEKKNEDEVKIEKEETEVKSEKNDSEKKEDKKSDSSDLDILIDIESADEEKKDEDKKEKSESSIIEDFGSFESFSTGSKSNEIKSEKEKSQEKSNQDDKNKSSTIESIKSESDKKDDNKKSESSEDEDEGDFF